MSRRVWLDRYPHVCCPHGHHVMNVDASLLTSTKACGFRHVGGARCGACVYVVRPWKAADTSTFVLVAEVSFEEIGQLVLLPSLEQQLQFLGLQSPGGRAA